MIRARVTALVAVLVASTSIVACSAAPADDASSSDQAAVASAGQQLEFDVTVDRAPSKLFIDSDAYFAMLADIEDTGGVETASANVDLGGLHIDTPRGNQDNWCSREAKAQCSSGGRLDLTCACNALPNICSGRDLTTAQKALGCRRSRASANRITVEMPRPRTGADVVWQGLTYVVVGVGACFASGVCEVVLAPVGL